jgi:Domain of Unknown Function (DUF1080)
MKKILIIPLLSVFVLLIFEKNGSALNPKTSAGTAKESKNSKIQLFNGKDLTGWYTFLKNKGKNNDPNKVFTVQNGMIRVSGQDFGCITTDNEYANYQLEIDFKWGEKTCPPRVNNARDSGVLLHSTGEDGGFSGTWMHSIECQLIEGGTGDFIVVGNNSSDFSITSTVGPDLEDSSYVYRPTGKPVTITGDRVNWFARDPQWKDVKGFRGAKDAEKPHGEWNKLKVIALGSKITVYLNGILVNYTYDVKPQKGKIQIQSEGAEIFFKRVEIKQL